MRDDQYSKLKALQIRLIDVIIDEADPNHWPGAGVETAARTKEQRGDRVWVQKSAAVSIGIAIRLEALTRAHEGVDPSGGEPDEDDDDREKRENHEMTSVQNEATAIIERVRKRAG